MVILVQEGFTNMWQSVELSPFAHQVGGHVGVFALDKNTVCKPQNLREYQFYQQLPVGLSKFVPKFKGVADVIVKQGGEGYLNLVAYPSLTTERKCILYKSEDEDDCGSSQEEGEDNIRCTSFVCLSQPHLQICKPQYRIKLSSGGHISINQDSDSDEIFEDESSNSNCRRFGCNPWSVYCHRQQIAKMQREQSAAKAHKFLLLEDVTYQFEHPCILDLKIGVRSYGDDASEEKIKSHTAKVEGTTSAKLGIRVCGMQMYKPDRGLFICRDKYYGRHLSEDGLFRTVREFLINDPKHGLEVTSAMMKKIKELIVTISKLDSYRFYGSSLLLIYEGLDDCSCSASPERTFCNEQSLDNTVNVSTQTDVIHKKLSTSHNNLDLLQCVKNPGQTESPSGSPRYDPCTRLLSTKEDKQSETNDQVWKENYKFKDYYHPYSTTNNDLKRDFDPTKAPSVYRGQGGDQNRKRVHLEAPPFKENTPQYHNAHQNGLQRTTNKQADQTPDKNQKRSCRPLVHIKMIDFAHTEFKEYDSGKHMLLTDEMSKGAANNGPDSGFIYGLENLFRIFEDILAKPDLTQK